MTKEIIEFNTLKEANNEKIKRRKTWRPLHSDLIDDKWRITFVKGIDDPDNKPRPPLPTLTRTQFINKLAEERGIKLLEEESD